MMNTNTAMAMPLKMAAQYIREDRPEWALPAIIRSLKKFQGKGLQAYVPKISKLAPAAKRKSCKPLDYEKLIWIPCKMDIQRNAWGRAYMSRTGIAAISITPRGKLVGAIPVNVWNCESRTYDYSHCRIVPLSRAYSSLVTNDFDRFCGRLGNRYTRRDFKNWLTKKINKIKGR